MKKLFFILTLLLLPSIAFSGQKVTVLSIWGPIITQRSRGTKAAIAEFEAKHPGVRVEYLNIGEFGVAQQKLLTSIVGKVPPDIVYQDRYMIGDWVSRDTFIPIDDLLAKEKGKDALKKSNFYPVAWEEVEFKNKTYGIPDIIGTRCMLYNKKLFREAGLDPNRPPRTWSELVAYSKKLTKYDSKGNLTQIGFIPMQGNSWLYLYSWQNGGEFITPDGERCTMNNPHSVAALKWLVDFYDRFGGIQKVNSFATSSTAANNDPFMRGKLAMVIDGPWSLANLSTYAPQVEYGVCPAPVPDARYYGTDPVFKGKPKFISWSGGFAWCLPVGCRHKQLAWEFIRYISSMKTQRLINQVERDYSRSLRRIYFPMTVSDPAVNQMALNEFGPKNADMAKAQQVYADMIPYSRHRPLCLVGERMWDEQIRSVESAVFHKMSAQQALDESTRVLQSEIDKNNANSKYPLMQWKYPVAISVLVFLIIIGIVSIIVKRSNLRTRSSRSEALAGFAFASPWLIGFLIFTAGPMVASLVFSFCSYDVLHPAKWVGAMNYAQLFSGDWALFSKSLYNAFYMAIFGIPLGMIVSFAIALLLNTKVKGMQSYRTLYYLPAIVPVVATSILWIWMLHPQFGLVNSFWRATLTQWFNIAPPLWLGDEHSSKPALIFMGLWGAGGGMILWLAGLQGISKHLYEAAQIDGAGPLAQFRHVTIPMMTPYILFNLIMGTIGVVQSFDAQYITTGGGPLDSTMVPVLYLFKNAFQYFKMGYASAIAWVLFALIMVLTAIELKVSKKWVHYDDNA